VSTYYMDEASFELPPQRFEDRSETVLEIATGDATLELRVQRGPAPAELAALTDERVAASKSKLRGCNVVFRRARPHPQAEVIEVGLRYRGDGGMLYRREAYLAFAEVLFVASVTGPIGEWQSVDDAIDCVLASASARDLER
jgi:hypothetical protein